MKETAYLLQSVLIVLWWFGLSVSDGFYNAFQFPGIGETAFQAFFLPDFILIATLSLARVYRPVKALEFIIFGGFAYASLFCVHAALLSQGGYLSTALMLIGSAYNAFLCFTGQMFRASTSTSLAANVVKTIVQIVCIWFLALFLVPYLILTAFDLPTVPTPGAHRWMGIALFLMFSALGLWSAWVVVRNGDGTPLPLDQTNKLITSGPYRHIRNPMVVAGIGQGLAIAVIYLSPALLLYAITGAMVWQTVVRPIEESDLEKRFGDSYVEYRQRVRCWFPRFDRDAA